MLTRAYNIGAPLERSGRDRRGGRGRRVADGGRHGRRAVRARLRGGAGERRRGPPRTPQRAATRHARLEEAMGGK